MRLAVLALLPCVLTAASPRRLWELTPFTYLRRVHAEAGAPGNSQPRTLEPAALAQALAALRFQDGKQGGALFLPSEAETLAAPLAEALAIAGPGEDLELLCTGRRNEGLLASARGVTARIFLQDDRLNVIVHDARLDYLAAYTFDNQMPSFDFGSRSRTGAVQLSAAGAEQRRGDWVSLALPAAGATPAVAVAPAAVAAVPAVKAVTKAVTTAAPAATPAPATAPAPAPAATPSASTVEQRLRDLKRFREQDLITEEEYVKQKQELLREFSKAGKP